MNAKELRGRLANVFEGVENGTVKPQTSHALANIADKMVKSANAQIMYYRQRNETPDIEFLREE